MSRIRSVFGEWANSVGVQALIDARQDQFKVPFFPRFFSMGQPQIGLQWQTVIGRSRIEAAASVTAHGAAAPLRGRPGLEKLYGEVVALKLKRQMDEDQYRNYLTIQGLPVSDDAKKRQMLELIWEDVRYAGNAIYSRLDIFAAQALNKGVVNISVALNPDGIAPGEIDLLVPAAHKQVLEAASNNNIFWLSTNAATMKPITEIKRIVRAQRKKGFKYEKILIHPEKLWPVLECTEVINLVKGITSITPGGELSMNLEMVNRYMVSQGLPYFEEVDVVEAIETDGVVATIEPWDKRFVTFVPAGQQGVMHNAIAIEEMSPVAQVSYAKYQLALISKWSQTEPFAEYTRGELVAFPGLETADSIVILDTESRTTFAG